MARRRTTRLVFRKTAAGWCTLKGFTRCRELYCLKCILPMFVILRCAQNDKNKTSAVFFLMSPVLRTCFLLVLSLSALSLRADGPYRNRDNKLQNDSGDPNYPVPYQLPTVGEITEVLTRIHGYLTIAVPRRVVNRKTGEPITDRAHPIADAGLERLPSTFNPLAYEMGVVHAGMLKARAVTGDPRFTAWIETQTKMIGDWLPYFRAQQEKFNLPSRTNSFTTILDPRALDDRSKEHRS